MRHSLSFAMAVLILAGCAGSRSSSLTPQGRDTLIPASSVRVDDPAAGINVTGSGPWKSVPLLYAPNELLSAVLSANSSVWFADNGASIIGEISASGVTKRYKAGSYGLPIFNPAEAARPYDVEAGPNHTTYYLTQYGYGVMSASGTPTLYTVYCQSNCGNAYLGAGGALETQMAVSSDGSAWIGAEIYNSQTQTSTPVIARAKGSVVSTIVVPGWSPQLGYPALYQPAWLTIGPDGNVWFSDGQAIGKITVATNAVTMYNVPAKYTNTNGWAADITSAHGALWVAYVSASPTYLLRVSTSGVINGFITPPSVGLFNGIQSSHGIAAGPNNTLYAAYSGRLISGFNITSGQFSMYTWPNQSDYGGALTITAGADLNMWAFSSDGPLANVFLPHSTISSTPASLKLKVGGTATVVVKEGEYTGIFTSGASACGAYATQASSSGTFTITGSSAGPSCYLPFSDSIGSGTVYVKVTVSQ